MPGEVIRFVLLSGRITAQPMDWTERKVEEAKATLNRWIRLNDRFRRRGTLRFPRTSDPTARSSRRWPTI